MNRILSPEFKTTSCPVIIDFLIRHGIINPENGKLNIFCHNFTFPCLKINLYLYFTEPRFPELVELLHVPLQSLYKINENMLTETNGLSKGE